MTAIDPQTLRGDWSYPTRVRFGPGRIVELAEACGALGMARPLMVTERTDGDIVRNGVVDFADFRQWKTAFVAGGGAIADLDLSFVAVPEPSCGGLFLWVAVAVLSKRAAPLRRR